MNTTLRIAMECHPLNLWFVEDSNGAGEGVSWHGRAAWQLLDLKSKLGLDYEVITDLPPPEHNIYSGARFNTVTKTSRSPILIVDLYKFLIS